MTCRSRRSVRARDGSASPLPKVDEHVTAQTLRVMES